MTRLQPKRRNEAGAATLVVVMMLFLVMALLAAYANRSVLFEQRMAVSYARASLSQETAEGGVEWTLAQLNGTAIDSTCKPVDTGGRRFTDRYLQIDPANRIITSNVADSNGVVDCARDANNHGWACRCAPAANVRTTPPVIDGQPASSFVVRMASGARSGTLQLNVIGCSDSVIDNCLGTYSETSKALLGKAWTSTLVGLVSAVRSPPAAPLVVRGGINSSGSQALGLHNTDPTSGGQLAILGGTWNTSGHERLDTVPGSAISQTVFERDDTLRQLDDAEKIFKKFMGASVSRYQQHPALRNISCSGDCSSAIEDAYKAGKRMLWVDGPMTIDSSKVLGTIDDPILVIANGAVLLSGSFQFTGMLVAQGDVRWTNAAGASPVVNGTMLVGGNLTTVGGMDIVYQQAVANQLRNRMGSYVRVPGSWIDVEKL